LQRLRQESAWNPIDHVGIPTFRLFTPQLNTFHVMFTPCWIFFLRFFIDLLAHS